MIMSFTKLQSAGNDFVLVETSDFRRNWSAVAVAICDRHFGVGADGLLLLLPSDTAHFQMRMFNPDGSEAEICGNGLMCMVKYVAAKGLPADVEADWIKVETAAGIRKARIYQEKGKPADIQVTMGVPRFGAKDIPAVIKEGSRDIVDIKSMLSHRVNVEYRELVLDLVSVGNPHAVYFGPDMVSDFPLSQIGPRVEHLSIFPQRINFEVARVVSREQIEARVWERGVGETLACGSGACAIAVSARLRDYIDDKVDIKLPGGILKVEWDGAGEIFLSAPAEVVFHGEWLQEV